MKKRIDSFRYAFRGIADGLQQQINLRIHFVAAIIAIGLGLLLQISAVEWCVLLLCIGAVIALELINTAIEKLCDFVEPQRNEKIRIIKDLAAAAVLVSAIAALITGCIIFLPKIADWIRQVQAGA